MVAIENYAIFEAGALRQGGLADLFSRRERETGRKRERWSARKTLAFLLIANGLFWGLVAFLLVRFVF